ncbi:hypothetical protein [Massilia timonae]|uniref:hypothetical protein n=1 Tax=Massilia timonae TaxID=47229 RepID=UPI0028D60489|nr:hypothetical protein [Massilia timonae]
MSYCRFSSDNFGCDVYVYEHVAGGFVTHVAGNRIVGDVPKLPRPTKENRSEYMAAHRAQMDFMTDAKREDIDLPHAGGSFSDDTAGECAARLESLRVLGYKVPQYAIDALREEAGAAISPRKGNERG